MRIVTWNCFRGDIRDRLARLETLKPDFVALQECRKPKDGTLTVMWRGGNPMQGVALVACREPHALRALELPQLPLTVVVAQVDGPTPFVLVNVWAQKAPTYEAFVLDAVRAVEDSMPSPTAIVVVGDLNSTPLSARFADAHAELIGTLETEFSLVSAYHTLHAVSTGGEVHPTHYWRWQQTNPFHIDYVFVPKLWSNRVRAVEVGGFADWRDSDHCPVAVDLDLSF